jgi:hypothetical protein
MRTRFADEWPTDATITVTISDTSSTTKLVDGGATTQVAADTVATEAAAETFSVVVTTGGDHKQGDLVAIGSGTGGFHVYQVDDYDSATKTLALQTGLYEIAKAGAAVRSLEVLYTVDASGWASNVDRVWVKWIPDSGGTPRTEIWDVQSVLTDVAGFEDEFRAAFEDLYDAIDSEDFDKFVTRARVTLKNWFDGHGRDFGRIADSTLIQEPMLLQTAILIADRLGMEEERYNRLIARLEGYLTVLNGNSIWIDSNEDGVQEESETQPAQTHKFARGGVL